MTDIVFNECMERMRNGDQSGLHDIYNAYLAYIYSVVYTILQNKENAEDVTSDFFIKLWSIADKYKPGNGHKGYLATIARNMALDYLRKHKREMLIAEFESSDEDTEGSISAENMSSIASQEKSTEDMVIGDMTLKEALATLKPKEREVINMKIMSDMTFQEIAEALGRPLGTVTWQYREAIEKLRRCGYE